MKIHYKFPDSRLELEPEDSDCARGVTSRFAYQTHTENNTMYLFYILKVLLINLFKKFGNVSVPSDRLFLHRSHNAWSRRPPVFVRRPMLSRSRIIWIRATVSWTLLLYNFFLCYTNIYRDMHMLCSIKVYSNVFKPT